MLIVWGSFKNTGISTTESVTTKRKKQFGFRNVWTLDGRIYYLV